MRPTTIYSRNGNKMTVSGNYKNRTATMTTYYKDGRRCGKYLALLAEEDVNYYNNHATWNDWVQLLHEADEVR